jgi:dienelactone hydrolase
VDYDPFARGPLPVGVRSGQVTDARRGGRRLPFEIWYPAAPRYGGLDLDASTQDSFTVLPGSPTLRQAAVRDAAAHVESCPLVLFSHSSYGHRRQSSFLCAHLASHGYVVAAADHSGNTFAEWANRGSGGEALTDEQRDARIQKVIDDRVPDVRLLLDELLGGAAGEVSERIDRRRVGVVGWSFGGWAMLAALEADDRFGAVVALAPAGSSNPLPGIIPATLTFAWRREVPALYLVAEEDRFTPLSGMYELFERTPSRKQMFILRHADHGHFADQIEARSCPQEHAHLFTRGLALAHLDATLQEHAAARRFLAGDPIAALRERSVDALAYDGEIAGSPA